MIRFHAGDSRICIFLLGPTVLLHVMRSGSNRETISTKSSDETSRSLSRDHPCDRSNKRQGKETRKKWYQWACQRACQSTTVLFGRHCRYWLEITTSKLHKPRRHKIWYHYYECTKARRCSKRVQQSLIPPTRVFDGDEQAEYSKVQKLENQSYASCPLMES